MVCALHNCVLSSSSFIFQNCFQLKTCRVYFLLVDLISASFLEALIASDLINLISKYLKKMFCMHSLSFYINLLNSLFKCNCQVWSLLYFSLNTQLFLQTQLVIFSLPVQKYRRSYCSHLGVGVGVAQMLKFLVKVFISLYLFKM